MSEADQLQAEVIADGVEVRKTLNVEDFSVPSLVFTILGPPDEAALIRVRDPIPDDVGAGNIGFHPKHGGQFWTFDGNAVTFSRRFEPGEEYTTVYGIVGVEPSTAEWLSAEPSVDRSRIADGWQPNGETSAGDDVLGEEGQADGLLERLANELAAGESSEVAREQVRSEPWHHLQQGRRSHFDLWQSRADSGRDRRDAAPGPPLPRVYVRRGQPHPQQRAGGKR